MDSETIKRMIAIMDEHKLAELEYQDGEKKVRLRKAEVHGPGVVVPLGPAPLVAAHPATVPAAASATAGDAKASAPLPENAVKVTSPLVGTFYRAPKPDAEPFVNVGDKVTADKVLCIIEAMKVMNEIKAETEGIVKEILVKNGQAVEYGEPLFIIEKT